MPTPDFYASFEQTAAGLAHEVRNPLSLVRANIDLLALDDTSDDAVRRYDMMRREIDRATQALTELMQLARSDERLRSDERPRSDERQKPKTQESPRKAVSLKIMLRELIGTLNLSYGLIATFSYADDGADCIVLADEESLQRMFRNILKNALESVTAAHADGTGLVQLALAEQDGRAAITITDNGLGLTDADASRISTPFFTTKSDGTGLGLHISRTAAEAHGGTLAIQGQPTGCTVFICLPLMSKSAAAVI